MFKCNSVFCPVLLSELHREMPNNYFLGPRGPLELPPVDQHVNAKKNRVTYIKAITPYESAKDPSKQPNGPIGSPLSPL